MIKKFKTLLFILTTLLCVTLTSCEDSGTIKGYDREMLDIVTYANNTEVKGGFTFTASESWSTIVDYGTPLRSDNGWITLDPASGNAGKVTINITLDENLTGEDRSATIRIICGETTLEINIVQRGTENTNNDGTQDNDSTGNEPSIRQPIYVIDRIIQTIDKRGMTVAVYVYGSLVERFIRLILGVIIGKFPMLDCISRFSADFYGSAFAENIKSFL